MQSIYSYAFYSCGSLLTLNISNCNYIGTSAFYFCKKLSTNISFSTCTKVETCAFYACWSIPMVSLPECTYIGTDAFAICKSLSYAYLPKVSEVLSYTFISCFCLSTVILSSCHFIGGSAFQNCYNLLSLNLTGLSSVPGMNNINAFSSTPISNYTTSTGGVYGSIYVPASLYNSFTTATNWTKYSARIVSV